MRGRSPALPLGGAEPSQAPPSGHTAPGAAGGGQGRRRLGVCAHNVPASVPSSQRRGRVDPWVRRLWLLNVLVLLLKG